jgi:hypothetical protein
VILTDGRDVLLRCLDDRQGNRLLDGHTHDGTVGLAPETAEPFSGTNWRIMRAGNGIIALRCEGKLKGPRFLDGRTNDGTVGLDPSAKAPFTGTRWRIVPVDANNPDIVALQCLGEVDGPRFLDGRLHNGTVGLALADKPFSGTRWEARGFPGPID